MKSKEITAVLLLMSGVSAANAISLGYSATASLISVSVETPGMAPLTATSVESVSPFFTISLGIANVGEAGMKMAGVGYETPYHQVNFSLPNGDSAIAVYPHESIFGYAYPDNYGNSYDPLTRTLSGWNAVDGLGHDFFCVGTEAICGLLRNGRVPPIDSSAKWSIGNVEMEITFNADFSQFTGTGSFRGLLDNGTTVIEHYALSGSVQSPAVPVPAAGWLLGSSLLGLTAGAVRRRKRSSKSNVL